MGIQLTGVPQAKQAIAQQLTAFRKRVNVTAREAMLEAVQILRQRVVEAMYAAGIQRRSGGTEEAILTGNGKPAVYGGDDDSGEGRIVGVVTTVKAGGEGQDPRMPMGAWLGSGTFVPAIANRLMVFVAPDGTVVFTRKRKAFQTPPRPFLNPATNAFQTEFVELLREHLATATVNP